MPTEARIVECRETEGISNRPNSTRSRPSSRLGAVETRRAESPSAVSGGKEHSEMKEGSERTAGEDAERETLDTERPRASTRRKQATAEGNEKASSSRHKVKSEESRHSKVKRPERTAQQTVARLSALYLVPILFSIPLSLVLALSRSLLTPLYNSIPLSLHPLLIYVLPLILPVFTYWRLTSRISAQDIISARVCLGISALAVDLVAVGGRRVGSICGELFGARWGAAASLSALATGVVGGGICFALLCFDHMWPLAPSGDSSHLIALLLRGWSYLVYIYYGEQLWRGLLANHFQVLLQRPAKTILFLSLVLTVLSFLLRPSKSDETFSQRVQTYYKNRKDLPSASRNQFINLAARLPSDVYPLLIILRLPLLVLILRQQLYLHPIPPYTIEDGTMRVLHSEQSLTGQIVVAENIRDGYRFMRCDHSILGGRWTREIPDGKGGMKTDLGDSIFGCFPLQEIGMLAHCSDPGDSITETISLTTELEMDMVGQSEKPEDRALIIGLGVGIAAASFARHGYEVDIVEIDPAVYQTAADYFGLSTYPIASVNLLSGSTYIKHLAAEARAKNASETGDVSEGADLAKWSLVIQDCFSGGSVPGEMFTRDFWLDLTEVVERDGIVAMNFVGLKGSKASRAVLVTLLSVFEQCRAFSDGTEDHVKKDDITNMVVFCTMTYSPLLTFRKPTAQDVLHSPLRSHVYTTFHRNEIHLDDIIQEGDWTNPEMMLTESNSNLDKWQVDTALATWKAMKHILTPAMWLAW